MTLGYEISGTGSTGVLVMHEWLGDHRNWDLVRRFLPGDKATFVFADLRGYGLSKPISGAYSLHEAIEDTKWLMARLGFATFSVVGHSMSGLVAQWLASIEPDRIKKLFLISPVPATGLVVDDAVRAGMMAVAQDDSSAKKAIIARTGGRYCEQWIDAKLQLARTSADERALLGYLAMITTPHPAGAKAQSNVPVTCLVGRHDIPAYQEAQVRASLEPIFASLDISVCEEAGHYAMLEAPPLTASLITRWVD